MFKKASKPSREDLEKENQSLAEQLQAIKAERDALNAKAQLLDKENLALLEEKKSSSYQQTKRSAQESVNSDFYAGIIDIPDIRSLPAGWQIDIKRWEEYQNLVKNKGTVVTVVGNYSKGKTFLFELLSGHTSPHGFNVNTQGISIVYLKDQSGKEVRPIIGLDTKGGSLPLDISALKDHTPDEKIEEDKMKEILRDHEATEDLLQNFILEEASIIIVMVADLTFDDQKLVNKIKKKFKKESSKKIIVVHNLYHTHYTNDVDYKVKEFISKAFVLEENAYKCPMPGKNKAYFVETSSSGVKIPHLILAKQHTEAGNFYNDMSVQYIKECINTNDSAKSIDVVEAFHEYLQKCLPTYVKSEVELKPQNIELEKDINNRPVSIRMNIRGDIFMKAVFADEFGHLHIFTDGFQPNYTLYEEIKSNEEKYLCLKVECPDSCSKIRSKVEQTTNEFKILVKGIKEPKKLAGSYTIADTRHFGEFFVQTEPFMKSKYCFNYMAAPQVEYVDGTALLKWRLLEPEDEDGWHDNNMK